MAEKGTLQVRINLTKVGTNKVKIDGPIGVYDQPAPGREHTIPLVENPMGNRINHGLSELIGMMEIAIKDAKYETEISRKEYQETIDWIKKDKL